MRIEIRTGGSAFHSEDKQDEALERSVLSYELSRLFEHICQDILDTKKQCGFLIDINGNKCGTWSFDADD